MRPPRLFGAIAVALLGCAPAGGDARDDAPEQTAGRAAPVAVAEPVHVVDDRGFDLTLPAPAGRIISLVPSFTTTLVEIGAVDQLVARTDFDDGPDLAHLPTVGGGLGPSREALLVVQPDLVLGFSGNEDPATPDWLAEQGIPYAGYRIDALADVPRVTRALGLLTGHEERGEALAREIEERLAEVGHRAATTSVRAVVVLGGTPPWVAGADSYLGELLSLAGGQNGFEDLGLSYGPVSPEVFLVRDLDVLLLMPGAEAPRGSEALPVLHLPAGIDIPGPALADHAEWLQRELAGLSAGPNTGSGRGSGTGADAHPDPGS